MNKIKESDWVGRLRGLAAHQQEIFNDVAALGMEYDALNMGALLMADQAIILADGGPHEGITYDEVVAGYVSLQAIRSWSKDNYHFGNLMKISS
jgi:hypothetical protein